MENEVATTPATPEVAAADNAPLTMDQAVEAYLGKTERSPAKDDAQAAATDAPQQRDADEAPDTEQSTDDAQDEVATEVQSEEYEFDVGGHKFKLSKDNVKDELPKIQAKYKELEGGTTRKFQEAAEARKAAETFQNLAFQNVDLFAEARAVHNELQQLQNIDVNALVDSDPVQALRVNNRLMQLQARGQQLQGAIANARQQLDAATVEQRQRAVNEVRTYAQSSIKGWTPDLDKALGDYVAKQSVKQESVQSLTTDPRLYEMAVKAYKYDALQTAKPIVEKKVAAASPAVKPNSANSTVSSAQMKARDAWGKFEKSGRMDDAVEAYLARQRVKGR